MCLLAQIEGATVLFLIALAITTGLLLFRTQRQLGAPKPPYPSEWRKPPAPARPAPPLAEHTPLRQGEVQVHELARELCARIDSKLGILETLIQDASQQLTRLESAIERSERLALSAGPATRSAFHLPAGHADRGPLPQAHQAAALAGGLRVDMPVIDEPEPRPVRRYDEIYSLADAGHGSDHIAQQLGSPIGEIELILGLRDQR